MMNLFRSEMMNSVLNNDDFRAGCLLPERPLGLRVGQCDLLKVMDFVLLKMMNLVLKMMLDVNGTQDLRATRRRVHGT